MIQDENHYVLTKHYLRLLGLRPLPPNTDYCLLDASNKDSIKVAHLAAEKFKVIIALNPIAAFTEAFNVQSKLIGKSTSAIDLFSCISIGSENRLLRSLNQIQTFEASLGEPLLVDNNKRAIWLSMPFKNGHILFVGTDIESDLCRFRQGDPDQVTTDRGGTLWGIAGERPNYLYQHQLHGLQSSDRQADYWAKLLADYVSQKSGTPLQPILPGNAAGAIVITGDDDQAYLDKYDEQLNLLGNTPVSYLLHPLTRHNRKSLRAILKKNPAVDFGIHPDALEKPDNYGALFDEQITWFKKLTGHNPISLRNHGFLNDGYWGHLESWLKHNVGISSNIPGFDGQVINGSLLPARVVQDGRLTTHWSVLTVIGDGVRFASKMSDEEAAARIWRIADEIKNSSIPGVIVLNLHPQNVAETQAMHKAAREIISSGFVAWNLKQCWDWFGRMDQSDKHVEEKNKTFLDKFRFPIQKLFHSTFRAKI